MDKKEGGIEELECMFTNESSEPLRISYSAIESVTKNFCQVIGQGGFGIVYLGALRKDVMVAVKLDMVPVKLDTSEDLSHEQFLREVNILNTIKHKNIVRFLGYCVHTPRLVMEMEGEHRLVEEALKKFLCFEYAPNGNLQDYLKEKTHGHEWSIRYKIIKGICEGLHYLHQKNIQHLDLKPANVLLGAQMEPKITDFGTSRCNVDTQSTVVTGNIVGTLGYMPPEFIVEGKRSFKTDIYSLGNIMIRLLMGNNEYIPDNWHESLTVDCQEKKRCIEIARSCTDSDPCKRPTIFDIIPKLTDKETTNQNVPSVIITEPRNDQTSILYKNVNFFLARGPETHEHYRWLQKLQAELPKWKLAFQVPPKFPIITGENIRDANGDPLRVILMDTNTGKPSSALPEDVLQIELVPLLGNFPRDIWNVEDFQMGIVEDKEWKRPVLAGKNTHPMWNGRTTVSELKFMDDSRYYGCMFRIGVRVVPDSYRGARILEGMTDAFMLRCRYYDRRCNKNYKWQLAFQSQPPPQIHIGSQIKDVIGNPLEVILVDAKTGLPSALPAMELRIELVLLLSHDEVGLYNPHQHAWSHDEFQRAVYKPGNGDGPYLSGNVSLTMKDGRATVNELQYVDISYMSYVHRHIGVSVVPGCHNDSSMIREGISKAFGIKASKDKLSKIKHLTPRLDDEVWRLRHISFGGVFHRRLVDNNVMNVQDFLRMLAVKPDELRAIVGNDMDRSDWSANIDFARACVIPVGNVYAYSTEHTTIYVNSIFDVVKVEISGVECPLQQLDEAQKILVQQAMQEAYEHRHSLRQVKLTLKLEFKSKPRLPINPGSRILDAKGNPLEIILVDTKTESPLALPTELKIELVPLFGYFPPYNGKKDWSAEEFQAAIVKQRQKDVPLLKRYMGRFLSDAPSLIMRDGRVTVGEELQFTDDSSWVRGRKFRIGAYVKQSDCYDGSSFRILEAMTEAFVVRDLNRKHYPPIPSDPIWRLEMIDKEGASHRKLTSNNVDTVQEFVRMLNVKPDELRAEIVGDAMTDRMWDMTARHAKDCDPGDKVYAYSGANSTIYIDSVFSKLLKTVINGVDCQLHGMLINEGDMEDSRLEYMIARQLILEAYEHRHNLQEADTAMELLVDDDDVGYVQDLLTITEHYMEVDLDDRDDDDDDLDDEDDDHAQTLVHAVAKLKLN